MFSVPQFIDIEDKIAGPLTWKQLGWLIALGAIFLLMRMWFDTALLIIAIVPTAILFLALAFYRPNGFPMTTFISNAVLYMFRPKVAMWERPVTPMVTSATPVQTVYTEAQGDKHLTREELTRLAQSIDSRGRS